MGGNLLTQAGQLRQQNHSYRHLNETNTGSSLLMRSKQYYGFNFQWMCSWNLDQRPEATDEKALDFLAEFGFNFIRIPMDYRFWTNNFDYLHPDESIFGYIDQYLEACQSRGIHLSLNLHRAPGYCTNRNDLERHNLWLDEIAQRAFLFLWETFACRYKDVP